jgi:hypothetical protein
MTESETHSVFSHAPGFPPIRDFGENEIGPNDAPYIVVMTHESHPAQASRDVTKHCIALGSKTTFTCACGNCEWLARSVAHL